MKEITTLLILSLFFLGSCGDSPFLNDETQEQSLLGTRSLNGDLSFANGFKIAPYWAVAPEIATESKITFLLLDHNDMPFSTQRDIRVKLWMPTMGHGSFPVQLSYQGLGVYQARDIFFTMPGYWDIHFQIFDNGVLQDEVKWPLSL